MPKRKHYKNSSDNSEDFKIFLFIIFRLTYLILYSYYFLKDEILTFFYQNLIYFYLILVLLLFLIFFKIIFFYKKRKLELLRIEKIPTLVLEIKSKIVNFKPLRDYNKEEPYQLELAGYLKNFFPNLDIEISKNYTRPDIVIDKIAIEIKGPTNFNDLKTIPDKIIRYTKEWDYLIIVLFNLKVYDYIYKGWKKDIEDSFPQKMDKIIFIEI